MHVDGARNITRVHIQIHAYVVDQAVVALRGQPCMGSLSHPLVFWHRSWHVLSFDRSVFSIRLTFAHIYLYMYRFLRCGRFGCIASNDESNGCPLSRPARSRSRSVFYYCLSLIIQGTIGGTQIMQLKQDGETSAGRANDEDGGFSICSWTANEIDSSHPKQG